jgi:hypothetical protein
MSLTWGKDGPGDLRGRDTRRGERGAGAGVDRVPGMGERAGGESAKTTGCAGDDDDLFHHGIPLSG